MVLQIRSFPAGIGFGKGTQLTGRHGQRSGFEQNIFHTHSDAAQQVVGAEVQGSGVGNPVNQSHLQMVLQIFTNADKFLLH